MNLQVLVAAMNQKDFSLIKKMNIQSDAIFANQADEYRYDETCADGNRIQLITTALRGVSKNRNTALMYADADIVLFSDDDMVYNDGYAEEIIKAFESIPNADALIFNIDTIKNGKKTDVGRRYNTTVKKVGFLNCMNYGTCRLAVKRKCIMRDNLAYNDCFGGGNIYSNGEDVIFISSLIKKKLKIYTYPYTIGAVQQDTSTWFTGYNEKYLYDKGALFKALSRKFANPICIQMLVRHKEMYKDAGLSFNKAYKIMKKGMSGYKKLISYDEAKKQGIL